MTDTTGMVERVARAIREAGEGDLSPMVYIDPIKAARAALQAAKNPTDLMREAGRNVEPLHSGPEDVFNAMISAALSEETGR